MTRALWFIADCIGNVVVVLGVPVTLAIDCLEAIAARLEERRHG
jgi:hypothetical protein